MRATLSLSQVVVTLIPRAHYMITRGQNMTTQVMITRGQNMTTQVIATLISRAHYMITRGQNMTTHACCIFYVLDA